MTLADPAFDAVGPIKTASNNKQVEEAGASVMTTIKEFVPPGGAKLRAAR
jgi:hypothetical protein